MSYTNSSDLYNNLIIGVVYPLNGIFNDLTVNDLTVNGLLDILNIPVLTQFYSSSFTTTTMITSGNYYRLALSGVNMLSTIGNSNFTNNNSSYINLKYIGLNPHLRFAKFTYNFCYKYDKINDGLTFVVYKNPTFIGEAISSGTIITSSLVQTQSPNGIPHNQNISIQMLTEIATNDIFYLCFTGSTSGSIITPSMVNIICELNV